MKAEDYTAEAAERKWRHGPLPPGIGYSYQRSAFGCRAPGCGWWVYTDYMCAATAEAFRLHRHGPQHVIPLEGDSAVLQSSDSGVMFHGGALERARAAAVHGVEGWGHR